MSLTYTLEHQDGSPAEPPTFKTAVANWRPGDTIPLGGNRTLRVVEIRPGPEPDDDPVLVVESSNPVTSSSIRKATKLSTRGLSIRADEPKILQCAAALTLVVLVAGGCGSSTHRATPAMLRQGCVVRWNWLHYDHAFVVPPNRTAPVTVRTNPCRLEIDYRLSRSDSLYKSYLGMYFRCGLNRFQAYLCDGHARGLPNTRPRRGQNARYFFRTGTIQLNRPPTKAVSVAKPGWVRRYPVTEGFIEPFDKTGQLRPGLRFVGRLLSPGCATYPDLEHSTFIFCAAGRSCFVPRLPVHDKELVACPVAPGSRVFTRGRLEALPKA